MTRSLSGFLGVFALSFLLSVGCSEDGGEGGTGGTAGTGGIGGSTGQVVPCTEQGIRDAIAVGGGPHTFDCDGPTTVVTEAEIVIDNDVILDGEGNLIVDGNEDHRVFSVVGVTAELRGFTVTRGRASDESGGGGISNLGTLTLSSSTVSGNYASILGGGIGSSIDAGTLTVTNSTVSGNTSAFLGGGIAASSLTTLTNSTVSGNMVGSEIGYGPGIVVLPGSRGLRVTLMNSTVQGGITRYGCMDCGYIGSAYLTNTLVDWCDDYYGPGAVSGGYNIESPGNTCGFDQPTDQVNVTAEQLNLGPLQDNGGPTLTHALGAGSVAIDQIPAEDCVDADGEPLTTDQRGEPRPETGGTMCDVGAFEVQP